MLGEKAIGWGVLGVPGAVHQHVLDQCRVVQKYVRLATYGKHNGLASRRCEPTEERHLAAVTANHSVTRIGRYGGRHRESDIFCRAPVIAVESPV